MKKNFYSNFYLENLTPAQIICEQTPTGNCKYFDAKTGDIYFQPGLESVAESTFNFVSGSEIFSRLYQEQELGFSLDSRLGEKHNRANSLPDKSATTSKQISQTKATKLNSEVRGETEYQKEITAKSESPSVSNPARKIYKIFEVGFGTGLNLISFYRSLQFYRFVSLVNFNLYQELKELKPLLESKLNLDQESELVSAGEEESNTNVEDNKQHVFSWFKSLIAKLKTKSVQTKSIKQTNKFDNLEAQASKTQQDPDKQDSDNYQQDHQQLEDYACYRLQQKLNKSILDITQVNQESLLRSLDTLLARLESLDLTRQEYFSPSTNSAKARFPLFQYVSTEKYPVYGSASAEPILDNLLEITAAQDSVILYSLLSDLLSITNFSGFIRKFQRKTIKVDSEESKLSKDEAKPQSQDQTKVEVKAKSKFKSANKTQTSRCSLAEADFDLIKIILELVAYRLQAKLLTKLDQLAKSLEPKLELEFVQDRGIDIVNSIKVIELAHTAKADQFANRNLASATSQTSSNQQSKLENFQPISEELKESIKQILSFKSQLKDLLDHSAVNLNYNQVFNKTLPNLLLQINYGSVETTIQNNLRNFSGQFDFIFLDGFDPKKDSALWSHKLFAGLSHLAANNAKLATFTAASEIKKKLAFWGWEIQKEKGFHKREKLVARYQATRVDLLSLLNQELHEPNNISNQDGSNSASLATKANSISVITDSHSAFTNSNLVNPHSNSINLPKRILPILANAGKIKSFYSFYKFLDLKPQEITSLSRLGEGGIIGDQVDFNRELASLSIPESELSSSQRVDLEYWRSLVQFALEIQLPSLLYPTTNHLTTRSSDSRADTKSSNYVPASASTSILESSHHEPQILIKGMGVAGVSIANYLKQLQIPFVITDNPKTDAYLKASKNLIGVVSNNFFDDDPEVNYFDYLAYNQVKANKDLWYAPTEQEIISACEQIYSSPAKSKPNLTQGYQFDYGVEENDLRIKISAYLTSESETNFATYQGYSVQVKKFGEYFKELFWANYLDSSEAEKAKENQSYSLIFDCTGVNAESVLNSIADAGFRPIAGATHCFSLEPLISNVKHLVKNLVSQSNFSMVKHTAGVKSALIESSLASIESILANLDLVTTAVHLPEHYLVYGYDLDRKILLFGASHYKGQKEFDLESDKTRSIAKLSQIITEQVVNIIATAQSITTASKVNNLASDSNLDLATLQTDIAQLLQKHHYTATAGVRLANRDRLPAAGVIIEDKEFFSNLAELNNKKYNGVRVLNSIRDQKVNAVRLGEHDTAEIIREKANDSLTLNNEINRDLLAKNLAGKSSLNPSDHSAIKPDSKRKVTSTYMLSGLGGRGLTYAPILAIHVVHQALGLVSPLPDALQDKVFPQRQILKHYLFGNLQKS